MRAPPAAIVALLLVGCCALRSHRTPEGIARWQDTEPPRLSLRARAERYQERLEAHFQTPEGIVRYQSRSGGEAGAAFSYGNLADGPFHTGIYLASQACRYATTGEAAARAQVLRTLAGLKLLIEVSGKRGLLARHVGKADAAVPISDLRWQPSPAIPGYVWRGDASKDQYAGFIGGLGTALALVPEPEVRREVGELAAAAADHLLENDLRIIDVDGRRTTHGNLRGRFLCIPKGVDALIVLAVFKVAAEATGEAKYREYYGRLLEAGYPEIARWAHFTVFGIGNRVNDNMAHLALYPLLLLETDYRTLETLWQSAGRMWEGVRGDHNAFFAFVHAALSAGRAPEAAGGVSAREEARRLGIEALREFPDDKVEWPVDLTRPGFDFPRAFLNTRQCLPRSKRAVPLYLRPRSSCFWASDPFRLTGNLGSKGDEETAGADYLLAYWMGRYHRFVGEED